MEGTGKALAVTHLSPLYLYMCDTQIIYLPFALCLAAETEAGRDDRRCVLTLTFLHSRAAFPRRCGMAVHCDYWQLPVLNLTQGKTWGQETRLAQPAVGMKFSLQCRKNHNEGCHKQPADASQRYNKSPCQRHCQPSSMCGTLENKYWLPIKCTYFEERNGIGPFI